jgi:hypothetical protein
MGIWDDITGTTAKRNAAKGLERFNNQQADIYGDATRQQFGTMAQDYAGNGQQAEKMDALGNVSAWLDPSMAYQQAQATRGVLGAFGGSGKLHSGAAMKALSDRQQGIAAGGWQQAMANYMNQMNANNGAAAQNNALNQQNFSNAFQTANMINQADATKFNTATQGRANVASVQAPSVWDAAMGIAGLGMQGLGTAAGLGWQPLKK